jgi:hypothetical protein
MEGNRYKKKSCKRKVSKRQQNKNKNDYELRRKEEDTKIKQTRTVKTMLQDM